MDTYVESVKRLPAKDIRLETADATYFHFKTDIFKREITYSTDKQMAVNLVTIDADRAFEVIALNKAGEKPLSLQRDSDKKPKEKAAFGDILGDDDLTRFDKKKRKKKKKSSLPQSEDADTKSPKADSRQRHRSEGSGRPKGEQKNRPQARADKNDDPQRQSKNEGQKNDKAQKNRRNPKAPRNEQSKSDSSAAPAEPKTDPQA